MPLNEVDYCRRRLFLLSTQDLPTKLNFCRISLPPVYSSIVIYCAIHPIPTLIVIFVFVNVRGRPPKWKSKGDMKWGYQGFLSCLVDSSLVVEGILSSDIGKTSMSTMSSVLWNVSGVVDAIWRSPFERLPRLRIPFTADLQFIEVVICYIHEKYPNNLRRIWISHFRL